MSNLKNISKEVAVGAISLFASTHHLINQTKADLVMEAEAYLINKLNGEDKDSIRDRREANTIEVQAMAISAGIKVKSKVDNAFSKKDKLKAVALIG